MVTPEEIRWHPNHGQRNLAHARSGLSAVRSGFVFVFLLAWFPVPILPSLLDLSRVAPVRISLDYSLVWFSLALSHFDVLRACSLRYFLLYSCVLHYQDLSANQWYIARLALDYSALRSTSDAAPSSHVPRFQRSGDSILFFASFRIVICSDLLLSDSLCTRSIGLCLAS